MNNPLIMNRMPEIAIGNETFDEIRRSDSLYVDKTGLLIDMCDGILGLKRNVHIYTRPTRFGKTLNLSMIDRFFNVAYAGQDDVFKGLEISEHCEFDVLKNRYPVIRLDMSYLTPDSKESLYESIKVMLSVAFQAIVDVYGDGWMSDSTAGFFSRVGRLQLSDSMAIASISNLSSVLMNELKDRNDVPVKTKPVIIVDEYDSFIQEIGKVSDEQFNEITMVITKFMRGVLKSNLNYTLGVITGIHTLSQTGIISGLNNAVIHNIFDEGSGRFFGYTEDDIRDIVQRYLPDDLDKDRILADIKDMYDGYVFGGQEIYNPRSVNMYLNSGRFGSPPGEYWERTCTNNLIDSLLLSVPEQLQDEIADLTLESGKTKRIEIIPSTIYQDLVINKPSTSMVYSYLAVTGYLKARALNGYHDETAVLCDVSLPSKEIRKAYESLIIKVRSRRITGNPFFDCLLRFDAEGATKAFNELQFGMSVTDSWTHDECKKDLVRYLRGKGFDARAERSAGNGRPDIIVYKEAKSEFPNMYIEITTSDEIQTTDLDRLLDECWKKFTERSYIEEDRNGMFIAFAWDRRFCRIGIRRHEDFFLK